MKVRKPMDKFVGEEVSAEELRIHKFLNGITDFQSPHSIMSTSAMLMNVALHMYSMVVTKEDLQELLMYAHKRLDEDVKDTIYH
jgi:hypothetical protein